VLLMQSHREFQIVTPRTLSQFHGDALVLPDVRVLSGDERTKLEQYTDAGKKLIITGNDPLQSRDRKNVVTFPDCPGKAYVTALEADFDRANPQMQRAFLDSLPPEQGIEISASTAVASSIAQVNGETHVFLANFAGLVGGKNPVQRPQNVTIRVPEGTTHEAYFLPFLGDVQPLNGLPDQGGVIFTLPPVAKGAVFWLKAN
jgi:hypothetical protein